VAISTYAELKVAITGWLDVSTATLSSQIDDLITVGEKRIFREARTRDMETAFNSAISSGVVALPASYVAAKVAYLNTSPIQILERRSAEWIQANYPQTTTSGIPLYFARLGTNFIFGPYPDSAYTLNGIYYARLTAISGSGVNALFTANPDLYLMACLAEAEMLIGRDPRIAIWDAKYQRILADVNGEDKTEDQSGSHLQMRVPQQLIGRMR
jgi:hypothetical protein